jgi:hypothetical protein
LSANVYLLTLADGTGLLLDLDGIFAALDRTGLAFLLVALRQKIDAAVESLAERFHRDERQVRADLLVFLAGLTKRSLLTQSTARSTVVDLLGSFLQLLARPFIQMPFAIPISNRWFTLFTLVQSFFLIRATGFGTAIRVLCRQWGKHAKTHSGDLSKLTSSQARQLVLDLSSRCWLPMSCKERALSAFAWACRRGTPAQLVLGVEIAPFQTHCWCLVEGEISSDLPGDCATFVPLVVLYPEDTSHQNCQA